MQLKSESDLKAVGNSPKDYLHLHPNDQKYDFCRFSFRSIILARGRNRKLEYDADK
jgi:hypothetical protein